MEAKPFLIVTFTC